MDKENKIILLDVSEYKDQFLELEYCLDKELINNSIIYQLSNVLVNQLKAKEHLESYLNSVLFNDIKYTADKESLIHFTNLTKEFGLYLYKSFLYHNLYNNNLLSYTPIGLMNKRLFMRPKDMDIEKVRELSYDLWTDELLKDRWFFS